MALRRILAPLFAVALMLGLAGSPALASTAVPTYTWKYTGTSVKVKNTTIFKIKLRTAADGGYSWVVTHGRNSPDFTIISRRVISPTGMVGGYAQTVWTIKATHLGTDYFSAVERRTFEKNSTIARFKLMITVIRR